MMDEINRGRPESDRFKVPAAPLKGASRRKSLCFYFATAEARGCSRRHQKCSYHHIDLHDAAWVRENVPITFLKDLLQFLESREVSQFYRPSAELKAFLDRR
jgi:hypothetical protein